MTGLNTRPHARTRPLMALALVAAGLAAAFGLHATTQDRSLPAEPDLVAPTVAVADPL